MNKWQYLDICADYLRDIKKKVKEKSNVNNRAK